MTEFKRELLAAGNETDFYTIEEELQRAIKRYNETKDSKVLEEIKRNIAALEAIARQELKQYEERLKQTRQEG